MFDSYKLFGLVDGHQRGFEGITAVASKGEASSVPIPTTYGTSLHGFIVVGLTAYSEMTELQRRYRDN
jgi:hypothetical protein